MAFDGRGKAVACEETLDAVVQTIGKSAGKFGLLPGDLGYHVGPRMMGLEGKEITKNDIFSKCSSPTWRVSGTVWWLMRPFPIAWLSTCGGRVVALYAS